MAVACSAITCCNAGKSAEQEKQIKVIQLQLLTEAEEACSQAHKQAVRSGPASPMLAVLTSLEAGNAKLHKLIQNPVDQAEEVKFNT